MRQTVKINNIDISSYITTEGTTVTYTKISGGNAGVSLAGTTITDYIAEKVKFTFKLAPIPVSVLKTLKRSIGYQPVSMVYTDTAGEVTTYNKVDVTIEGITLKARSADYYITDATIICQEV